MTNFLCNLKSRNKSINLDKFFKYVFQKQPTLDRGCRDGTFNDYLSSSINLFETFTGFEEQKQKLILDFLETCFHSKKIYIDSLKQILEIPLNKLQDREFQTMCRALSTNDIFKGSLIRFIEGKSINEQEYSIDNNFGSILKQRSYLESLNSESLELFENLTQALNIKTRGDYDTHLKDLLLKMNVGGINKTVWDEIIQTIKTSYSDTSSANKTNIIQSLGVFLSLDQSKQKALETLYETVKQGRQDLDFITFLRSKLLRPSVPPQPSGASGSLQHSEPSQPSGSPGSSQHSEPSQPLRPSGPPQLLRPSVPPQPSGSPKLTIEQITKQLTQTILNSSNFGGFLEKLFKLINDYQDKPDLFWPTFRDVIRLKLKTYLQKSRDDNPFINSDGTYRLIEIDNVKNELSLFRSTISSLNYMTRLPEDQNKFIEYILSENKDTRNRFELFCKESQLNAHRKRSKDICEQSYNKIKQHVEQITQQISSTIHHLNFQIHNQSDSFFYLDTLIKYKDQNENHMHYSVLQFQYHATLFTGIRTLIRACIKSEGGKLSKDAENNYIFYNVEFKKHLSNAMNTLNKDDIIGKTLPTLEEFIDYIFSEEPSQSFKQFITEKCQGRDIFSQFQQINTKLDNGTSPTIEDKKLLNVLNLDSFYAFLQSNSENRFDTVPFVKELLEQREKFKKILEQYRSRHAGAPAQRVGKYLKL